MSPLPHSRKRERRSNGLTPVTTDYVAVAAKSKHKEEAYKFVRWYTTEGQIVQGKNIPAWQRGETEQVEEIIDTILSATKSPEKVDKKSLVDTLVASKASAISSGTLSGGSVRGSERGVREADPGQSGYRPDRCEFAGPSEQNYRIQQNDLV